MITDEMTKGKTALELYRLFHSYPENVAVTDAIEKLIALAQWCKPDEHSPPEHWAAYLACSPASGGTVDG